MIRPGSCAALFALFAFPVFAGHSAADEIPADLMAAVMRARYAVRFESEQRIPAVSNYAHDLRARFEDEGIKIELRAKHSVSSQPLGIRLRDWGRDGASRAPGRATRQGSENRVEYRYEGITEWWVNAPRGLEQGFTIAQPPAGDGLECGLPVVIDLEVSAGWHAELAGAAIDLRGPRGEHLNYSGLVVTGADGTTMQSRLSVHDGAIRITVEDRDASYPITIDPLFTNQEAKLLGAPVGGASGNQLGFSVALSGDTALVGADRDDTTGGANAGSAYVFVRNGTGWSQQAQLLAIDGAVSDHFGTSVALSGNTALVGAPVDDTAGGIDAGSAHVFVRSVTSWSAQVHLLAVGGAAFDNFGFSVALSGDTALVGADTDDSARGSAYVFFRSGATWSQQAQLLAGDRAAGDRFGQSVALSGNTAVVGAPFDDTASGGNAGSAYVFVRSGASWTQQDQLLAGDGAVTGSFGYAVALSGETALVGVYDEIETDGGSAYVFVRSGASWSQQAQLRVSNGAADELFGFSVALSGDTALVGAAFDEPGGDAGSAFVFVRSGANWSQEAQLLAGGGEPGDLFGYSVALSGNTALVGAPLVNNTGGSAAGSAYLFVRSGVSWTQQAQLFAAGGAPGDLFGISAALSGDTAVVGAAFDDTAGGIDSGSAYVFVRSGTGWSQQTQLLPTGAAAAGDRFGQSVAVSGDTAVVGAYLDDTSSGADAGSAYVFIRSGSSWFHQQQLLAGDAAAGDNLGISVALSGDTALVGASLDGNAGGLQAGSAYVFVRSMTSWTEQAQLFATDGSGGDIFAGAVALSGDTALIGASLDDTVGGTDAGSAYVFVRSGTSWTQQKQLLASDGAANDAFGKSVALSDNTALVGSYRDDTGDGTDAGTAWVFVGSGASWSVQAQLFSGAGAAGDQFGESVALSGDTILVGAGRDDTAAGTDAGSAWVFTRSGQVWSPPAGLLPSGGGAAGDIFGISVALSGDTAVVGAFFDDTGGGSNAGAAYVFRLRSSLSRGDANADGALTVADVFYLLNYLFAGGPAPGTPCAGDADADSSTTVADPFFLINHLFSSAAAPTPCT